MELDLNLLSQSPDFSASAVLIIDALAPLSMVTSMPGKYYRSQPEPTPDMLYGLLENALGWHIPEKERSKIIKQLEKKHKVKSASSGVGFQSLLQFHLRFAAPVIPPLMHYDDLWSQNLKGGSFLGGSRNYDYRVIPLMNAERAKRVAINDRAEADKNPALIDSFQDGDKVHVNVVRPYFPQYYASPTPREYIVPKGVYKYALQTSPELVRLLAEAAEDPAAPLYLGSNDGWVEIKLENMQS